MKLPIQINGQPHTGHNFNFRIFSEAGRRPPILPAPLLPEALCLPCIPEVRRRL